MKEQLQSLPGEHKWVTVVNKLSNTAGGHHLLRKKKKNKDKRKNIIRDTLKNSWSCPHFAAFGVSSEICRSQKETLRHQIQLFYLNEEGTLTTHQPFLLSGLTDAKPLPEPFKARSPLNPDAPGSPIGPGSPTSPFMPRKPRTPGKPGVPVSPWSEAGPGGPRGPGGPAKPGDSRENCVCMVMFKNKPKSLQIKHPTNMSLCSPTGTQWLNISLYFVCYLQDFSEVFSFTLCTQMF